MNGATTTTTQLDLPFEKIVGRPPHQALERDLTIPEQALRSFAERIWREQRLLLLVLILICSLATKPQNSWKTML